MPVSENQSETTRVQILVRGIVQGVGFRPFIFSLAKRSNLRGKVFNNSNGVLIDVEGDFSTIEQFISDIKLKAPPLSLIDSVEPVEYLEAAHYDEFHIVESISAGERLLPISADVATCVDCLRELADSLNRRYRYPFINCTNCGPRFTIIEDVPYDREKTTMRDFAMCVACREEYENPLDRRFHAEPTACDLCGPKLYMANRHGVMLGPERFNGDDIVEFSRRLIRNGSILAIKGVGGFHLAADALSPAAVRKLRESKYREDKPFAMMARSLEVIREYCSVSLAEEELLLSAQRPVVLLAKIPGSKLPPAVAPRVGTFGFMLPYSPLHHLLLEGSDRPLVMTSGNISDEPICYRDGDAIERLGGICEYFLLNDRRIHMRTDDSVSRVHSGRELVLRRARGYAPAPIKTTFKFEKEILACGAELKNTFCLARGNHAFISHHIGDLENLETLRSFREGIEHFKRLFDLRPEAVAYDLHPEYLSTKFALGLDDVDLKFGVQHHHAHVASCLLDNCIEGEVIGVAMDGLGFGHDGRLWGGEFFIADLLEAERVAHLDYIPMPGGAKSIREPWRMAAIYLHRAFGDEFLNLDIPFVQQIDRKVWPVLRGMAERDVNSPQTSSMGRLFDAVAALLNLRTDVNYEGQAAIELEAIADRGISKGYEFEIGDNGNIIKAERLIRSAVDDLLSGARLSEISARFHLAVRDMIVSIAHRMRDERHLNRIALSGGVFQNMFLLKKTIHFLERDGFQVFTHHRVPANDGGISLGQAAVANARLASGRI